MKTSDQRATVIEGLKRIALKHLMGFLGIALATALFFIAANYITCSGHTLVDMRGFQVIEEVSDTVDLHMVPDQVTANGLAEKYYLIDADSREELLIDLARWDTAGSAWTSPIEGITAFSTDNASITFNLPDYDKHYYIYTFPGLWDLPPQGWDSFFKDFNTSNIVRLEFDYTLYNDLDSLMLFFHQYDDEERIDRTSWHVPSKKGNNNFTRILDIHPDSKSFRVYLRFANKTENKIALESLKLITFHGYNLLLTEIENNFKKLSFDLHLSEIAKDLSFFGFRKKLDLKGRSDYQDCYFFISVETDELDKEMLSFLEIKVLLDEALVWSSPVSEIGNPTFIEQNIDFLNNRELSEISFHVGCDSINPAEHQESMDHSIHIAFEYFDIR